MALEEAKSERFGRMQLGRRWGILRTGVHGALGLQIRLTFSGADNECLLALF